MDFVRIIGNYKVWHYPRKHIYRVSPIDNPTNIMRKDFKDLQEIVNFFSKSEATEMIYTDPYNIAIKWLRDHNNRYNEHFNEVNILLRQYYYGIEAKKELKNLLIEMKLL